MLIEISITNYRSLKEKSTLSLIADGYDSKSENINLFEYANDKKLRLHNSVLIFGANGSGKSNIVRGLWTLTWLLNNPRHEGEPINFFDPFKFNVNTKNQPNKFEIKFLDSDAIPYLYVVSFNSEKITEEKLTYWPNNRETEVFTREILDENSKVHVIKIGKAAQEKNSEENIYKNNFAISHFSSLTPNEVILNAFNSLKRIRICNSLNIGHRIKISDDFGELLINNEWFNRRVNALIRYADLNINLVRAEKKVDSDDRKGIDKFKFYTQHYLYNGDQRTDISLDIPLKEESEGSQTIISLGSEIIHALDEGGALIVDEFETSLHPKLSKALIRIFQSKKLNPKKAQLIFTTHDTNLMDHHIFRRDQIWFTEKNSRGETELFSMIDFDNLREGHVFEKWYLSGKFGALPQLETIEKAFG
ncbi:MAG: ATP-binding protein [Bacteroidales bacterium]|jgi:AAA15 family ATPase/GTPase|nr:ATP-binding protein [Bacteroidales bacterium]